MKQSRFTMNAFMLIVLIFSAIVFVFTLLLSGIAERTVINDFYKIEDSSFAILYSNKKTSGLYEGPESSAQLRTKGIFGHDWGIALEGNYLYVNEYTFTDVRLMHCQLVRIDLTTFEKEVICKDAILRGRCASGELVCLGNFLMPSDSPETNPLCELYSMTAANMHPEHNGSEVMIIDPADAKVLYTAEDLDAMNDDFETRFLERTLDEIMN